MIPFDTKPNDRRHFLHKRILGAAKSFVTSGFNPLTAAGAFIAGPAPRRQPAPRGRVARPTVQSAAQKEAGRALKFDAPTGRDFGLPTGRQFFDRARQIVGAGPCPTGQRRDATGKCGFFLGTLIGPDDPEKRVIVGDAVMGRYGAAYMPGSKIVDRAVCLAGDVVGDDGLCYSRGKLRNNQRQWPRGRRPLLTGGDMRAISTAARAAGRLERTTKRLQKIGLMKKPAPRLKAAKPPLALPIHHV